MMKFKRDKVFVLIKREGEKEPHKEPVDSWIMGDFSYWECSSNDGEPITFDGEDCLYQVTHNPTGTCVIFDIPNERKAREIIRKLTLIPYRWNGRGEIPIEFKRQVKEVIKEYL